MKKIRLLFIMKEACPTAAKIISGIKYYGGDKIEIITMSEFNKGNEVWRKLGYLLNADKYVYKSQAGYAEKAMKYLLMKSLWWQRALKDLDKNDVDLIQTITPDYIPILVNRYLRKPLFHHFRELLSIFPFSLFEEGLGRVVLPIKELILHKFEERALKLCDVYTSDSIMWLNILKSKLKEEKEFLTIKNAPLSFMIPEKRDEKLSRQDNCKRIVYHGHININSMNFLKEICLRGIHLHIYPIIKDERVRNAIYELKQYNNFAVHPNIVGYKELIFEISKYDYGLIPPSDRNLGLYFDTYLPCKLFDYLAAGLTILAGNYSNIRKFVEANEVGYIVNNVDELVEVIEKDDIKEILPITADEDIKRLIDKFRDYL